jgi:cellulose synthase operon protein C
MKRTRQTGIGQMKLRSLAFVPLMYLAVAALVTGVVTRPSPSFAQPAADSPASPTSTATPGADTGDGLRPDQREVPMEKFPEGSFAKVAGDVRPLDMKGDEQAELGDFSRTAERFEEESKGFSQDLKRVVDRRYTERLRGIRKFYEERITDLETEEKLRREDAIAQFELFLKRYPKDPRYTPNAIIRLAELYFEKSETEYLAADREYNRMLELFERGEITVEPVAPSQDFGRMVALYSQLVRDFPEFGKNDVAYYMLGYSLRQMGDPGDAAKAFQTLVRKYPASSLVPEAWTLLGEIYFEEANPAEIDQSMQKAILAYGEVMKYPNHPYFDKALYKQAWTYYRINEFDQAVSRFLSLIDLDQKRRDEKGEAGSDLRPEAVRYIAISFTDEAWDKGGFENLQKYFEKLKDENPRAMTYEREIFIALAEAYFERTDFNNAIKAYRYSIEIEPSNATNPTLQAKVIECFDRQREVERAAEEREVLVTTYATDSEWYRANENDPEAIIEAQRLMEESLQQAGAYYHVTAQTYQQRAEAAKDDKKKVAEYQENLANSKKYFKLAAAAHRKYLERFPFSKMAYDVRFLYADALFFTGAYEEAAREFESVRDSTGGDKFLAESGAQAVISYQIALEDAIKRGDVPKRELKNFEGSEKDPKVTPENPPPLALRAIGASDAYIDRVQPQIYATIGMEPEKKRELIRQSDENAALAAYLAGEQLYLYDQFDAARQRLFVVVQRYPKSEYALDAVNMIIQTYIAQRNWDKVRETTELAASLISQNNARFLGIRDNAIFYKALDLLEKNKYEQAAIAFLEVVEKNPNYENADVAYYNAALCYSKTFRYVEAYRMYNILYQKYPNSKLADEALFRVAVNAEKSYKYDESIAKYRELIKRYPDSKHRWASFYNLASQLEYTQKYEESARQYVAFNQEYPENDLAPGSLYDAANVYEKLYRDATDAGRQTEGARARTMAIDAYAKFINRYGSSPKESARIVEAHYRIAKLYEEAGDDRKRKDWCGKTMNEYKRRGLERPKAPKAAFGAAECAFEVAEGEFEAFKKIQITGSAKPEVVKKELLSKAEALKKAKEHYKDVFGYGDPEWILAAYFRLGFTDQTFAESLINSPCPKELKRMGDVFCDEYKALLVEQAAPIEDRAVAAYEDAYRKTRELGVVNEWVQRIEEALSAYRPDQYPLLKEPAQYKETHIYSSESFVVPKAPEKEQEPGALGVPPQIGPAAPSDPSLVQPGPEEPAAREAARNDSATPPSEVAAPPAEPAAAEPAPEPAAPAAPTEPAPAPEADAPAEEAAP